MRKTQVSAVASVPTFGSPLHHSFMGVGRQQLGPVRGGESAGQRRYFLRGSILGVGECGTRAGETAGEHQQNLSSTEPRLANRCAVHSSRGLHKIPVKYNSF